MLDEASLILQTNKRDQNSFSILSVPSGSSGFIWRTYCHYDLWTPFAHHIASLKCKDSRSIMTVGSWVYSMGNSEKQLICWPTDILVLGLARYQERRILNTHIPSLSENWGGEGKGGEARVWWTPHNSKLEILLIAFIHWKMTSI